MDFRTGYVQWCRHCELPNDDHEGEDHAFERATEETPVPCAHCQKIVDRDFHYGVFVSITSYVLFDSAMCAYEYSLKDNGL
jgi:hypothetical protein